MQFYKFLSGNIQIFMHGSETYANKEGMKKQIKIEIPEEINGNESCNTKS